MNGDQTRLRRGFLKDTIRLAFDFSRTDQSRGVAPPPVQKPYPTDATRIDLVPSGQWETVRDTGLLAAIGNRMSHRQFRDEALTLEDVSLLLWATQGIRRRLGPGAALRTVPSAGCRHAFEAYLCALNVTGLDVGIYRYLPVEHQLLLQSEEERLPERLVEATLGQSFTGSSSATFVWTTIPYRMEWRYGPAAHRAIAIDAGHVCQNLYLAVEAIGAGTCAIAAYHQGLMDQLLGVDGDDEFVIYLAPVGKV